MKTKCAQSEKYIAALDEIAKNIQSLREVVMESGEKEEEKPKSIREKAKDCADSMYLGTNRDGGLKYLPGHERTDLIEAMVREELEDAALRLEADDRSYAAIVVRRRLAR
jgi:hypothetical protein